MPISIPGASQTMSGHDQVRLGNACIAKTSVVNETSATIAIARFGPGQRMMAAAIARIWTERQVATASGKGSQLSGFVNTA